MIDDCALRAFCIWEEKGGGNVYIFIHPLRCSRMRRNGKFSSLVLGLLYYFWHWANLIGASCLSLIWAGFIQNPWLWAWECMVLAACLFTELDLKPCHWGFSKHFLHWLSWFSCQWSVLFDYSPVSLETEGGHLISMTMRHVYIHAIQVWIRYFNISQIPSHYLDFCFVTYFEDFRNLHFYMIVSSHMEVPFSIWLL